MLKIPKIDNINMSDTDSISSPDPKHSINLHVRCDMEGCKIIIGGPTNALHF